MSETTIPENHQMTIEELAAELVNRGGSIMCSSEFTPEEILEARRDNRFASADDLGFVLVVPRRRRRVVRDTETGQFTAKERAITDKSGTVEEEV